jgi:trehalose 6-phosphate phosphatase
VNAPAARPDWALFLDVDGTLVELADTPDAVRVPAALPGLLRHLAEALGGAVALVSGRSVAMLDRFFHPLAPAAVGLHGAEWRPRPGGPVTRAPTPPVRLDGARSELEGFAARHPGVLVEDKGLSLVLHFRRRPDAAAAVEAAARAAAARLGGHYSVLRGKMMLEIKPNDVNKGAALRRAMADPPFAGRVPVFVGDDVTDEDGFAAVNALGGHSVKVGLDGPTAATHRLADVAAVHAWLDAAARRLPREAAG